MTGDGTYRRLTASVLVAHQRRADSGCLCGWGDQPAEYGKSWAEHVAGVLDAAGALRGYPPPRATRLCATVGCRTPSGPSGYCDHHAVF